MPEDVPVKEGSIDISTDLFAKSLVQHGVSSFKLNTYCCQLVDSFHSGIKVDLVNKVISLDRTVKPGEALTEAKFNPYICHFPCMILHGLVRDRARRAVQAGRPAAKVLVDFMMSLLVLDELCLRYSLPVQVECAQLLGQRIGGKSGKGDFLAEVNKAIHSATFNKQKVAGFDRPSYISVSNNAKNRGKSSSTGGKRGKKRGHQDWSPYTDATSAHFVPPGWCIFKFGMGQCSKTDKDCRHKHTKWTAAELQAAKDAKK